MTTPFDNKNWQLRYISTSDRLDSGPLYQVPAATGSEPQRLELAGQVLNNLASASQSSTVNYQTNDYLPLIDNAFFTIDIATDPDPAYPITINFLENVPEDIRETWAAAKDIYYEQEYHTIRGNLDIYSQNGSKEHFRKHFMLTYKGRSGIMGSTKRLRIDFFDYSSVSTATVDLLLETYESWICDRGAWIAD